MAPSIKNPVKFFIFLLTTFGIMNLPNNFLPFSYSCTLKKLVHEVKYVIVHNITEVLTTKFSLKITPPR